MAVAAGLAIAPFVAVLVYEEVGTTVLGFATIIVAFQLIARIGSWRWGVWDGRERVSVRTRRAVPAAAPHRRPDGPALAAVVIAVRRHRVAAGPDHGGRRCGRPRPCCSVSRSTSWMRREASDATRATRWRAERSGCRPVGIAEWHRRPRPARKHRSTSPRRARAPPARKPARRRRSRPVAPRGDEPGGRPRAAARDRHARAGHRPRPGWPRSDVRAAGHDQRLFLVDADFRQCDIRRERHLRRLDIRRFPRLGDA